LAEQNKDILNQLKIVMTELAEKYDFNKDENSQLMSPEQLKEIFLVGFAKQIQLDIEQFFEFDVNITDSPDEEGKILCHIIARLKDNFETDCCLLEEFLLLKNLEYTQQMFGIPEYFDEVEVMDGIATYEDSENNNDETR